MTARSKRQEALRARRLAQAINAPEARHRLLAFANELEAQADALEIHMRQLRLKSSGNPSSKVDKDKE